MSALLYCWHHLLYRLRSLSEIKFHVIDIYLTLINELKFYKYFVILLHSLNIGHR